MLETFQIKEIDVPGPNNSSAEWDRASRYSNHGTG